jgi:hypothetical protein
MVARLKLRRIILLAPYLSERRPVGMERTVWQRGGIAAMTPSCCSERPNSALRIEKMDVWTPSKMWVRVWVKDITMRL